MDTNDLSRETYNAIVYTAEYFHHDLTLQFGVLASDCDTDDEFLDKSELLIKEWQTIWESDEIIVDIFFDDLPSIKDFSKIIDKILLNIESVRKIPIEKRIFDLW